MPRPFALIIEDQAHLAVLYEDTLRLIGYDVFSIRNGLDALNHLTTTDAPPDFVILDVNLPSLSGRDILKHIRRSDKYNDTPVLVLTANTLMIDQMRTEISEQDFLHAKPIGMLDLQSYAKSVRQQIQERIESRLETQPTAVISEEDTTVSEMNVPDDSIKDAEDSSTTDDKVQMQEAKAISKADADAEVEDDNEDEATT